MIPELPLHGISDFVARQHRCCSFTQEALMIFTRCVGAKIMEPGCRDGGGGGEDSQKSLRLSRERRGTAQWLLWLKRVKRVLATFLVR